MNTDTIDRVGPVSTKTQRTTASARQIKPEVETSDGDRQNASPVSIQVARNEGGIVSTDAGKMNEDRLSRACRIEELPTSANVALTRCAPSASLSPGLRELARELGRLAARAESRRARRGSLAVLDPWALVLLALILVFVAVWPGIGW